MQFLVVPRHGSVTLESNMEYYGIDEYINIPASYKICLNGEIEFKKEDVGKFLDQACFRGGTMVLVTFKDRGGSLGVIISLIPMMPHPQQPLIV